MTFLPFDDRNSPDLPEPWQLPPRAAARHPIPPDAHSPTVAAALYDPYYHATIAPGHLSWTGRALHEAMQRYTRLAASARTPAVAHALTRTHVYTTTAAEMTRTRSCTVLAVARQQIANLERTYLATALINGFADTLIDAGVVLPIDSAPVSVQMQQSMAADVVRRAWGEVPWTVHRGEWPTVLVTPMGLYETLAQLPYHAVVQLNGYQEPCTLFDIYDVIADVRKNGHLWRSSPPMRRP